MSVAQPLPHVLLLISLTTHAIAMLQHQVSLHNLHATGRSVLQVNQQTARMHPWKTATNPTAEVYLVRHGQNVGNVWVIDYPFVPFPSTEAYWDGGLTGIGVEQALRAQDILQNKIGLASKPPGSVQLAASLNARAYDTLVIASAVLWNTWYTAGTKFYVHGVPAAMEFDSSVNSNRKPGVADDDPARWQDSVLAANSSVLANLHDSRRKLLYQTAGDAGQSLNMTAKPVQVQAQYARNRSAGMSCNPYQLSSFASYLVSMMSAGKRHIVVGSHGSLIFCFVQQYSTRDRVPTDRLPSGIGSGQFPLDQRGLNNADVLHMKLRVNHNKIALEPIFRYANPIETS